MFIAILITIAITAVGTIIYASTCEWTLHRFIMHRPLWKFRYPFEAHALVHHRVFKADETYHLIDKTTQDKWTIPMAWWNGPILIITASLPSLIVWIFLPTWGMRLWMYGTNFSVIALYYAAYEYMHWCMHLPLPRRRIIERRWIFFRLNGHHLLHHRYMKRNFNVVLPLADLFTGTLLLRAPVHFKQARGPSVPDVQPLV